MVGGVFISVDIFLFTLFVSCEKINSVGILYPCALQAVKWRFLSGCPQTV